MSGKVVVDSIAKNVARLIGENRRLRGEVEKIGASREKLREENRRLAAEVSELERRLTVKELAADFGGGGIGSEGGRAGVSGGSADMNNRSTKVARARVNRLLREVDKCIGLLNKE